jgi:hypothetical protein
MAKILAALWHRDTHDSSVTSGATIFALRKALTATKQKAESLGIKPAPDVITSIFVAPEFLFTRSDDQRKEHSTTGVSRARRNAILTRLDEMARGCPGMLIVPGTIVFKEDITKFNIDKTIKSKENLKHAMNPGQVQLPSRKRDIKNYVTWEARREKFAMDPGNEKLSERDVSKKVFESQIEELTLAEKILVLKMPGVIERSFLIKNRTYVYFDGKKVMSYGKKINADDYARDDAQGIFVPGKKSGVATIGKKQVGFEICADHSLGTLKDHLSSNSLDLHVICSAEVPATKSFFAAKEGGYVLHASASDPFTTAHKVAKIASKSEEMKPIETQDIDGKLKFFELDI